ncbi:Zn-ribbon domain-containing OB-fold protein [Natrinema caseinilyticum]|uniref:Zn-ribbon domain-containing OB-fold protein n=1 Tax=Natrinema caseinilyticum TaxID=2961570 RepID=UPI0020C4433F|nr:OB-fold domain-containing protein [Natrinema caseinilyticum]
MSRVHPEYDESRRLVDGSIRTADDGDPVLVGTECAECGFVVFPTRPFCRNCLSENVDDIDLSRNGELRTYTVAHTGQEGFEPPYAFGFVDLPEGVRLYSLLKGWESGTLEVGAPVELTLDEIKPDPKTGEPLFGHVFRLVEGDDD